MILSDRDIRDALARLENQLVVDPLPPVQALQPASLELTIGNQILIPGEQTPRVLEPGVDLVLNPGEFGLATTVERVRIPTDLVAQVNGKSSWARLGLMVHVTAGFIDPGFDGTITLELANVGTLPVSVPQGAAICQLVFFKLTSPAERPYGTEGLGSHYQGQDGVTPSAI